MTEAGRDQTLLELRAAVVIAVLRAPDADSARRAAAALVDGGIRAVEITYTTPEATAVIDWTARTYGKRVAVGAGTVTTAEQAQAAATAGARFLVSPGLDAPAAAAMRATGRLSMVGALTPSELMAAARAGDVVKLFPGSLGGPAYLRALRGPFPDVPIMPTGGVTLANLRDWLDAGAVAVGVGGELAPTAAIVAGQWSVLTDRARAFTAAVT